MLEKRWEGNPEWEAYRARTNALIPWFPRRP
jgi:steroid 5-alpha reductase family enzyme